MRAFRQDYLKDVPMRAVDLSLHCLGSFALVGASWAFFLQWCPDIWLPVIFTQSMITGKYLEEDNWFLKMHRYYHDPVHFASVLVWLCMVLVIGIIFMLIGIKIFTLSNFLKVNLLIGAQWGIHMLIDHYTHKEGWL
jgi:hypothetical protein